MTSQSDNELLETYVPVYDVAPEKPEDLRAFIVEQFKRMANAINVREVGFYLDQEVLTGKVFIPGANDVLDGGTSQQARSILRKVVVIGEITVGDNPNTTPHGLMVDNNFTLIQIWASATNSTTFKSVTFSNPDTITMDATNIYITSDGTYDRCNAFIEYIQEV